MARRPPSRKPPKKRPDPTPRRYSATELALELEVDRRTITNWVNSDPACPSHGAGDARYFLLAEVTRWLRDRERREAQAAAPTDIEEARARKLGAEARLAELELAKAEGAVIPLEVHAERLQVRCEQLAGACKGLGRYVRDVVAAVTEDDADELLERIGDDMLEQFRSTSDYIDDELDDGGATLAA